MERAAARALIGGSGKAGLPLVDLPTWSVSPPWQQQLMGGGGATAPDGEGGPGGGGSALHHCVHLPPLSPRATLPLKAVVGGL